MKHSLIFLLHLFFFSISFSQHTRYNKKDSSRILNAEILSYDLESNEKSKLAGKLPFNKITFFDVRYDTSFIAINWQANTRLMVGPNSYNKKFNLTGGLAASLSNYLNELYKDNFLDNNAELLCFVKKFSFTLKDTLAEDRHSNESINDIKVELECFYKTGSLLFPAKRFDTNYVITISRIKKTFSELVRDMINPFSNKLGSIDSGQIVKRNSYTVEQIKDRYQSRFNIPILTAYQYKRGVYKNFTEFRNNAPSVTNFKVKTKGSSTFLYDSGDNAINPLNIFGFSDGRTCWIQSGIHCFPLVRVGNSFEFLYPVYVRTNNGYFVVKLLLALSMESGKIY